MPEKRQEFDHYIVLLCGLVRSVEDKFDLPQGALWQLYNDDDWSFVIKIHAMFESALVMAIVGKSSNPMLAKEYSKLPMESTSGTSLISLSLAMEIIDKAEKRFLSRLCQLRNTYAHDFKMMGLALDEHFSMLDKNQKKEFTKCFNLHGVNAVEEEGAKRNWREVFESGIKHHLWESSLVILISILSPTGLKRFDDEMQRVRKIVENNPEAFRPVRKIYK